jgi:hypothetical protein
MTQTELDGMDPSHKTHQTQVLGSLQDQVLATIYTTTGGNHRSVVLEIATMQTLEAAATRWHQHQWASPRSG